METDDLLRCTECGAETNTSAGDLFESMGRTKAGKWRKRSRWLKTMAALVEGWLCDDCLTKAEAEQNHR